MFDRSLLKLIGYHPWRYTTPPTYDAAGNQLTPGVTQSLDGVFILLSDTLIDMLVDGLDQADADLLRGYAYRVTAAQAGTWHVPVWAGQSSAVFIRVPAAMWDDPASAPPLPVRRYFQHLWREISE